MRTSNTCIAHGTVVLHSKQYQILQRLSDGAWHSGQMLSQQLGISRHAVCKHVHRLLEKGFNLETAKGKGYRLSQPIEWLREDSIRQHYMDWPSLLQLSVFPSLPSTQDYLLTQSWDPEKIHVCVAEMQTEGRGRHGRTWVSPPATNIYMSMAWYWPHAVTMLQGLSIAVGISLAELLQHQYKVDVRLKWPNDLLYQDKKLGGILVDIAGDMLGPSKVVIGVGLNLTMASTASNAITQPWIDLQTILNAPIARNKLLAEIVSCLYQMWQRFAKEGLQSFYHAWDQWDAYRDQSVVLHHAQGAIAGIARGIDSHGALLLEVAEEIKKMHSGEVSLRALR